MSPGSEGNMLNRLRNDRGVILPLTLMLTVILVLVGAELLLRGTNSSRLAERQRRTYQALDIAEAGLEQALYDLRQDFRTDTTSPAWNDGQINTTVVNMGNTDSDGYYPLNTTPVVFNNGTYTVKLKNVTGNAKEIWIRSTGIYNNISQTIQVYAKIKNDSIWNNVIFAGRGASGAMINGNVDINGSVHILGTGLQPTDYVCNLGGTADLIGNNYKSMAADLFSRIPPLATTVFNGETVTTLDAVLRVRTGIVGLSGSARVGEPDIPGNGKKETVDAVYANNGFGGTQGTANVFSDNGWSNGYDMDETVTFPSLNDSYEGTTYQQYLRGHAYVISNASDLAKFSNLTPTSGDFSYTSGTNSITKSGANLTINGLVYIDGGTLNINGGEITYTGNGSMLVTGDVTIDSDFVTPSGSVTYPNNIIGIMTPGTINIGTTAQMKAMGLFYAENSVIMSKQTQVVGSLVSNYFNLGNQVPKIFHVPEQVNNLPEYMIGGNAGWAIKIISWQLI